MNEEGEDLLGRTLRFYDDLERQRRHKTSKPRTKAKASPGYYDRCKVALSDERVFDQTWLQAIRARDYVHFSQSDVLTLHDIVTKLRAGTPGARIWASLTKADFQRVLSMVRERWPDIQNKRQVWANLMVNISRLVQLSERERQAALDGLKTDVNTRQSDENIQNNRDGADRAETEISKASEQLIYTGRALNLKTVALENAELVAFEVHDSFFHALKVLCADNPDICAACVGLMRGGAHRKALDRAGVSRIVALSYGKTAEGVLIECCPAVSPKTILGVELHRAKGPLTLLLGDDQFQRFAATRKHKTAAKALQALLTLYELGARDLPHDVQGMRERSYAPMPQEGKIIVGQCDSNQFYVALTPHNLQSLRDVAADIDERVTDNALPAGYEAYMTLVRPILDAQETILCATDTNVPEDYHDTVALTVVLADTYKDIVSEGARLASALGLGINSSAFAQPLQTPNHVQSQTKLQSPVQPPEPKQPEEAQTQVAQNPENATKPLADDNHAVPNVDLVQQWLTAVLVQQAAVQALAEADRAYIRQTLLERFPGDASAQLTTDVLLGNIDLVEFIQFSGITDTPSRLAQERISRSMLYLYASTLIEQAVVLAGARSPTVGALDLQQTINLLKERLKERFSTRVLERDVQKLLKDQPELVVAQKLFLPNTEEIVVHTFRDDPKFVVPQVPAPSQTSNTSQASEPQANPAAPQTKPTDTAPKMAMTPEGSPNRPPNSAQILPSPSPQLPPAPPNSAQTPPSPSPQTPAVPPNSAQEMTPSPMPPVPPNSVQESSPSPESETPSAPPNSVQMHMPSPSNKQAPTLSEIATGVSPLKVSDAAKVQPTQEIENAPQLNADEVQQTQEMQSAPKLNADVQEKLVLAVRDAVAGALSAGVNMANGTKLKEYVLKYLQMQRPDLVTAVPNGVEIVQKEIDSLFEKVQEIEDVAAAKSVKVVSKAEPAELPKNNVPATNPGEPNSDVPATNPGELTSNVPATNPGELTSNVSATNPTETKSLEAIGPANPVVAPESSNMQPQHLLQVLESNTLSPQTIENPNAPKIIEPQLAEEPKLNEPAEQKAASVVQNIQQERSDVDNENKPSEPLVVTQASQQLPVNATEVSQEQAIADQAPTEQPANANEAPQDHPATNANEEATDQKAVVLPTEEPRVEANVAAVPMEQQIEISEKVIEKAENQAHDLQQVAEALEEQAEALHKQAQEVDDQAEQAAQNAQDNEDQAEQDKAEANENNEHALQYEKQAEDEERASVALRREAQVATDPLRDKAHEDEDVATVESEIEKIEEDAENLADDLEEDAEKFVEDVEDLDADAQNLRADAQNLKQDAQDATEAAQDLGEEAQISEQEAEQIQTEAQEIEEEALNTEDQAQKTEDDVAQKMQEANANAAENQPEQYQEDVAYAEQVAEIENTDGNQTVQDIEEPNQRVELVEERIPEPVQEDIERPAEAQIADDKDAAAQDAQAVAEKQSVEALPAEDEAYAAQINEIENEQAADIFTKENPEPPIEPERQNEPVQPQEPEVERQNEPIQPQEPEVERQGEVLGEEALVAVRPEEEPIEVPEALTEDVERAAEVEEIQRENQPVIQDAEAPRVRTPAKQQPQFDVEAEARPADDNLGLFELPQTQDIKKEQQQNAEFAEQLQRLIERTNNENVLDETQQRLAEPVAENGNLPAAAGDEDDATPTNKQPTKVDEDPTPKPGMRIDTANPPFVPPQIEGSPQPALLMIPTAPNDQVSDMQDNAPIGRANDLHEIPTAPNDQVPDGQDNAAIARANNLYEPLSIELSPPKVAQSQNLPILQEVLLGGHEDVAREASPKAETEPRGQQEHPREYEEEAQISPENEENCTLTMRSLGWSSLERLLLTETERFLDAHRLQLEVPMWPPKLREKFLQFMEPQRVAQRKLTKSNSPELFEERALRVHAESYIKRANESLPNETDISLMLCELQSTAVASDGPDFITNAQTFISTMHKKLGYVVVPLKRMPPEYAAIWERIQSKADPFEFYHLCGAQKQKDNNNFDRVLPNFEVDTADLDAILGDQRDGFVAFSLADAENNTPAMALGFLLVDCESGVKQPGTNIGTSFLRISHVCSSKAYKYKDQIVLRGPLIYRENVEKNGYNTITGAYKRAVLLFSQGTIEYVNEEELIPVEVFDNIVASLVLHAMAFAENLSVYCENLDSVSIDVQRVSSTFVSPLENEGLPRKRALNIWTTQKDAEKASKNAGLLASQAAKVEAKSTVVNVEHAAFFAKKFGFERLFPLEEAQLSEDLLAFTDAVRKKEETDALIESGTSRMWRRMPDDNTLQAMALNVFKIMWLATEAAAIDGEGSTSSGVSVGSVLRSVSRDSPAQSLPGSIATRELPKPDFSQRVFREVIDLGLELQTVTKMTLNEFVTETDVFLQTDPTENCGWPDVLIKRFMKFMYNSIDRTEEWTSKDVLKEMNDYVDDVKQHMLSYGQYGPLLVLLDPKLFTKRIPSAPTFIQAIEETAQVTILPLNKLTGEYADAWKKVNSNSKAFEFYHLCGAQRQDGKTLENFELNASDYVTANSGQMMGFAAFSGNKPIGFIELDVATLPDKESALFVRHLCSSKAYTLNGTKVLRGPLISRPTRKTEYKVQYNHETGAYDKEAYEILDYSKMKYQRAVLLPSSKIEYVNDEQLKPVEEFDGVGPLLLLHALAFANDLGRKFSRLPHVILTVPTVPSKFIAPIENDKATRPSDPSNSGQPQPYALDIWTASQPKQTHDGQVKPMDVQDWKVNAEQAAFFAKRFGFKRRFRLEDIQLGRDMLAFTDGNNVSDNKVDFLGQPVMERAMPTDLSLKMMGLHVMDIIFNDVGKKTFNLLYKRPQY